MADDVIEPQTPQPPTGIPDGPTEPVLEVAAAPPKPPKPPADPEPKKRPKREPAYKYDPRNAIYEKRAQNNRADQAGSDEAFDGSRTSGTGLPREEEDADARAIRLEEEEAQRAALASTPETVTIKVYGVERQVPKAEVELAGGVAAYQKAAAADQRLQQAASQEAANNAEKTRLLKVAENLRQGLDEHGQPLAPKPPVTGVPASASTDAMLDGAVDAIYSGDKTEAKKALSSLLTPQAPANLAELVRATTAQVLADERQATAAQKDFNDAQEANKTFQAQFKDIADDPDMMVWAKGLAANFASDPANAGKSRSEIAQLVGARIREKTKPDPIGERRRLKETLETRSDGNARHQPPEPERPPTNADYIQQLRRNSGANSVR